MSTFKHNKGKLVEQPSLERPDFYQWSSSVDNTPFDEIVDKYEKHIASLRTYIAEGNFLEDELVEEKDLEIVYQIGSKCGWYSIPYEIFKPYPNEARKRIIARRKTTKEKGEKLFIALTFDTMMAGGNTDNEKAFFKLGYEVADKEIERLKGLIEKAFMFGWMSYPDPDAHDFMQTMYNTIDTSWEKFKSENNLT